MATDIMMNPTIQGLADLVLPLSFAIEHDGFVSLHGCNQPGQFNAIRKVIEPAGECKSDLEIMLDLDHRINPDRDLEAEPKWKDPYNYLNAKIHNFPKT